MLNQRLKEICQYVDSWCNDHKIDYSIVCDESDIQGVLLLKKDKSIGDLMRDLEPRLVSDEIHLETKRVRGGTIFAFSVRALSESQLASIIAEAGEEEDPMTFADKIGFAFDSTTAPVVVETDAEINAGTLLVSAARIANEEQYKPATQGMARSNQTGYERQRIGRTAQKKSPKSMKFENKISSVFELPVATTHKTFNKTLSETLSGMATPDGTQPGDLFDKFATALMTLGQSMGGGPLQDQLKKQGINWKKSDDGQSIIMFVVNAQTKAPQPIARISAETLTKPSDFENQLLNIMDFAKGEAPGTFKMKQAEAQAQEKTVREIAKQMGPQDPNAVQMGGVPQATPQARGAPAAAPAPAAPTPPPQPSQPVPQATARQAAMPKQPMQGQPTNSLPK